MDGGWGGGRKGKGRKEVAVSARSSRVWLAGGRAGRRAAEGGDAGGRHALDRAALVLVILVELLLEVRDPAARRAGKGARREGRGEDAAGGEGRVSGRGAAAAAAGGGGGVGRGQEGPRRLLHALLLREVVHVLQVARIVGHLGRRREGAGGEGVGGGGCLWGERRWRGSSERLNTRRDHPPSFFTREDRTGTRRGGTHGSFYLVARVKEAPIVRLRPLTTARRLLATARPPWPSRCSRATR